jgi:antirestriction protein
MMATDTEPRLWVGCLSCYNGWRLTGRWATADECKGPWYETMYDLMAENLNGLSVCKVCGGDEWWGMDVEGLPASWSEEMSPAAFVGKCQLRDQIEGQSYDIDAYVAYEDNVGREYASPDEFMDAYCGHFESEQDYARELATDCAPTGEMADILDGSAPWPYGYIDWEGATRDLFIGDFWSADCPTGGVYVFRTV